MGLFCTVFKMVPEGIFPEVAYPDGLNVCCVRLVDDEFELVVFGLPTLWINVSGDGGAEWVLHLVGFNRLRGHFGGRGKRLVWGRG